MLQRSHHQAKEQAEQSTHEVSFQMILDKHIILLSPREVGAAVPEACVLLLVAGKIRVAGNRKPRRHDRG